MDVGQKKALVRRGGTTISPLVESPFRLIRSRAASELRCVAAAALRDSGKHAFTIVRPRKANARSGKDNWGRRTDLS
jgi:hypothetical protein